MWGALLMLGSTNKKLRRANYIFAILWITYMFFNADLGSGLEFTIANVVVFALVFCIGRLAKGKYSNKIFSAVSIIMWSVIIDIVCYYIYPQFVIGNQSIFSYIGNGIVFNYKFALVNILAVGIIDAVEFYMIKGKTKKLETVSVRV